jgi:hypothetical protein
MKPKLQPTQNNLREQTRRAVIDLLNQQLADVLDLGLQTKQAHWNVKGPHFIGLHELFDKDDNACSHRHCRQGRGCGHRRPVHGGFARRGQTAVVGRSAPASEGLRFFLHAMNSLNSK